MTEKEALMRVQKDIELYSHASENGLLVDEEYLDFLETVANALECASPKTPNGLHRHYYYLEGYCPTCGVVVDSKSNYCARCGQKLDWEVI